jgi:nucleoside-diphosphate-sugar epimerase
MKVALTGATGFVGSHVLADLHKHGHEVTALVRDDAQADTVAARGATPAVVDLYDRPTVARRDRQPQRRARALTGGRTRDRIALLGRAPSPGENARATIALRLIRFSGWLRDFVESWEVLAEVDEADSVGLTVDARAE